MIGYDFINDNGFFWRNNQGGLLPLSSPRKIRSIDPCIAKELLRSSGAHFIRWESNFDEIESGDWWHIIKSGSECIEELPKKTRYMIKRASKDYRASLVSRDEIIANGHKVYLDAYARYETHEPVFDEEAFVGAVARLPDQTEFWAVYDSNNEMVGFSENFISENTCFYVTMWLCPLAMKKFASYLLFHEMAKFYLNERKFDYVSDGSRSLSHNTNIHNFLEGKFNFRKAYASLNVEYSRWLYCLIVLCYPFRYFFKISWPPAVKARILLNQEGIRRKSQRDGVGHVP